jgi:predicted porin
MRKTRLALLVGLAVAAPMTAQADDSSVTLYGRVNVTVESTKVQGQPNVLRVVDNSSRIGFRGKEDLGGGMNAIFQVESRIRADQGGDTFASRTSFVGLQGGFGTVRLGRDLSPVYYQTYDWISNHNHDTGNSSDALLNIKGFMNNSVIYTTPALGPVKGEFMYSRAGETDKKDHHISAVVMFDQGPIHAALGYQDTRDDTPATSIETKDSVWTVGGSYTFGNGMSFGGIYERSKERNGLGGEFKRKYGRVAAVFPFGNEEFHLNFGEAGDEVRARDGAKQWTVGWNHKLSKRSKVYAFYTKIDNEQNGNYHNFGSGVGLDETSFAVGVRHNF